MFTGIITHQLPILSSIEGTFIMQRPPQRDLQIGQSICHDGACMTVTEITDETYTFFAMQESLQRTTYKEKKKGDSFNVEFCVQPTQTLDGHIVTGHVDTIGSVLSREDQSDGSKKLTVGFDPVFDQLVVPKGSICLNGISLTVCDVGKGILSVWLIPHTLQVTNIGQPIGGFLNIEFDLFAKYATRWGRST